MIINLNKIYIFTLLSFLCVSANAEGEVIVPADTKGMYYFDWFKKPELTKCKKIDTKVLRQLKRCSVAAEGSGANAVCKINNKSEFLIFKKLASCNIAKDEMEANGD